MFIGKFDPKTLKLTEYPIKKFKHNAPTGLAEHRVRHTPARSGSTPCTRARSAALDPKTGEIKYYPLDAKWNDDKVQLNFTGLHYEVDNKVWTKSVGTQEIFRVDLKTGDWEKFRPLDQLPGVQHAGIYQVMADSHNNLWMAEFTEGHLGKIDAKTGAGDLVRHADRARPRPPHGDRRPGPRAGDRISHQQGGAVRSEDRTVHRIRVPAIHLSRTAPISTRTARSGLRP